MRPRPGPGLPRGAPGWRPPRTRARPPHRTPTPRTTRRRPWTARARPWRATPPAELAEDDPNRIHYVYKGADNVHEIVQGLLRSGGSLPDADAQRLSNDWNQYLIGDYYSRIASVDAETARLKARDETEQQRLQAEGARAAAGQGGLVSALAGMIMPRPGRKAERERRANDADRRKVEVDHAANAEVMRRRLYDAKMRVYHENAFTVGNNVDTLARSIRNYNDAFLDAPEAQSLKELVERTAGHDDERVAQLLEDIGARRASAELTAEYDRVKAATLSNARVVEAQDRYVDDGRKVRESLERQVRLAKENQAAFRGIEGYEPERFAPEMSETLDNLSERLPKPVSPEAAEALKKSFEDFANAVKEGISNFFRDLASHFSGPK